MAIYGNIVGCVGGAGGGISASFSIQHYASESSLPGTAGENTIAVITDTSITSWTMSAKEPETPSSGMVWILTGISSPVAFNILSENDVQIYPLKAYQYIDGAWVGKTAKSFQNGEWVDWFDGLFYDNGDQRSYLTGGWTNEGWTYHSNTILSSDIYSTHMKVTGGYSTTTGSGVSRASIVGTVNKISVDSISKIYADIEITNAGSTYLGVTTTSNAAESLNVASDIVASVGTHTLEIDVSTLTGDYYIVLFAVGTTNYGRTPSAKIIKVWSELSV